jgi:hypothetical protein
MATYNLPGPKPGRKSCNFSSRFFRPPAQTHAKCGKGHKAALLSAFPAGCRPDERKYTHTNNFLPNAPTAQAVNNFRVTYVHIQTHKKTSVPRAENNFVWLFPAHKFLHLYQPRIGVALGERGSKICKSDHVETQMNSDANYRLRRPGDTEQETLYCFARERITKRKLVKCDESVFFLLGFFIRFASLQLGIDDNNWIGHEAVRQSIE